VFLVLELFNKSLDLFLVSAVYGGMIFSVEVVVNTSASFVIRARLLSAKESS